MKSCFNLIFLINVLEFLPQQWFRQGLGCHQNRPTSKSWLRAAIELSSLKSIREVAKVRKKVPSGKSTIRFSGVWVPATSHVCGAWIPRGWITFDSALEQLREDAVGGQLMEDAAQELLGHPCCIARNHHAGVEQRQKGKEESWNKQRESRCLCTYFFRVQALTHQFSYGLSRNVYRRDEML